MRSVSRKRVGGWVRKACDTPRWQRLWRGMGNRFRKPFIVISRDISKTRDYVSYFMYCYEIWESIPADGRRFDICNNTSHEVSNHRPRHCLFNRLFRHISKKHQTSALLDICEGNLRGNDVSMSWRHHMFPCHVISIDMDLALEW